MNRLIALSVLCSCMMVFTGCETIKEKCGEAVDYAKSQALNVTDIGGVVEGALGDVDLDLEQAKKAYEILKDGNVSDTEKEELEGEIKEGIQEKVTENVSHFCDKCPTGTQCAATVSDVTVKIKDIVIKKANKVIKNVGGTLPTAIARPGKGDSSYTANVDYSYTVSCAPCKDCETVGQSKEQEVTACFVNDGNDIALDGHIFSADEFNLDELTPVDSY